MLIILFGLTGSGKSLAGTLLAQHDNFYFWDADDNLTSDMQEVILNKQFFTQEMRDNQTQLTIRQISRLLQAHRKVVIAQALYKEENRKAIKEMFPESLFVYLNSPTEIREKRIFKRKGMVDKDYASQINKCFEPPQLPHFLLNNDHDEVALLNSLTSLLKNITSSVDNILP